MEDPCPEHERETASSMESPSGGAPSATSGSGSKTSAEPSTAPADARKSARTVESSAVIEGWRLEDFSGKTGHAIGRSAQIGDLQVCLSVGETDGSEPRDIPSAVVRWLMTGELPERTHT